MGRKGVGMDAVEEAIRNPGNIGEDGDGAAGGGLQRILGGAGVGVKKGGGNRKEGKGEGEGEKEPFRRVVEKPFWKHREPEE